MPDRSYHHGNLRTALLDEAERTLREQGVEGLSLRDLARRTGVSHAAPQRHFPDRQALLDALAEVGFLRLGDALDAALGEAGEDYEKRLRATATGYVRFATENAALLDLMFATKNTGPSDAVRAASARLFTAVGELITQGQEAGVLPPGDPERLRLLLIATLQGIAALVTSGRARPGQTAPLITDAVGLFLRR